jgi:hypothetical protein
MSTQRQTMRHQRTVGASAPLLAILIGLAVLVVIFLFAIGKSEWAIPVAILALVLLAVGLIESLIARQKVARHGGRERALEADADDSVPMQAVADDVPLGASADVHADLGPHDLPQGTPARQEVKERRGEGPPVDTTPRPVPPGEPEPGG